MTTLAIIHEVDAPTRVRCIKPGARLVSFNRHHPQGSHARAVITAASNRAIRGPMNTLIPGPDFCAFNPITYADTCQRTRGREARQGILVFVFVGDRQYGSSGGCVKR